MRKNIIYFLLLFCIVICQNTFFVKSVSATNIEPVTINAKSAILLDADSGEIIYERNKDERLPVASMTKIATLSVVFDYTQRGIINLDTKTQISSYAASVGGSTAFLDASSIYTVSDLIKTVIISSANDSAVALSELVAGSEENFVRLMNKLAVSLNLKNTHFENATGLPKENHYSSAYDMSVLYKTISENEIFKKYSKIWMDTLVHPSGRRTQLVNTNRLVKTFDGIVGGKTGYTDSAKFCLTASAKRNDTHLIGVVIGEENSKQRFSDMTKLFDYGFSNYETKTLVNSLVKVNSKKFKFSDKFVNIYPSKDYKIFANKLDENVYTTDYEIFDLKAPLKSNSAVGKIYILDKENIVVDEVDLIIKEDINQISLKENMKKIISAI